MRIAQKRVKLHARNEAKSVYLQVAVDDVGRVNMIDPGKNLNVAHELMSKLKHL